MTSTSSDAWIDPDLQALLDWVPRPLTKAPEGSTSKTSGKTSFYDKHLSDRVVLKHVKLIDSLVDDIASIVDKILNRIRENGDMLPPYAKRMSAQQLLESHMAQKNDMANELAVTHLYLATTATYCTPAASLLALYPHLKTWKPVLFWTIASANRHFAITDGTLQFIVPSEYVKGDERARQYNRELWDSCQDMEILLRDVMKSFKDLAIFEIKSLTVGDDEVMQGIRREAHTDILFPWVTCEGGTGCPATKHTIVVPSVGPDGDDHPWKLPLVAFEGSSNAGSESLGSALTLDQGESETTRLGKRKRDEDDPTYKTAEKFTSQDYLQQAWAKAVRVDATVLILHSGNYEYVAVRHRETQTLFLSDIYQPHALKEPRYGKLHIGIYISAVKDALDRFNKLPKNINPPPEDNDYQSKDRGDGDGDNAKGSNEEGKGLDQTGSKERSGRVRRGGSRGQSASRASGNKMAECQLVQIIEMLSKRKRLFMYLQFGIYDSPVPATFVRMISPFVKSTPLPDEYVTLVLSSELAEGATGVVHGGTLEMETPEQRVSLDIVAKLAFNEDRRENLKHEFSIYCRLASKGVKNIPTLLGPFDNVEDDALALLLTPAGVPIVKGKLSAAAKLGFRLTLAEIHQAGILHGDIRRQNLLINDSGEVTIIDFDQSKESPSTEAMAREMTRLVNLLD